MKSIEEEKTLWHTCNISMHRILKNKDKINAVYNYAEHVQHWETFWKIKERNLILTKLKAFPIENKCTHL